MQRQVNDDELRGVVVALAVVAPAIWGHHPKHDICPLELYEPESEPKVTSS